jgi:mycofactocin precursor
MDAGQDRRVEVDDSKDEDPLILEEVIIEEIFVDGICGVY